MMFFMPSFCLTLRKDTSVVLNRIWNYQRNYTQPVRGLEQNVYMRYGFKIVKRNPILFLVPTMYVIAEGDREFIAESYNKVKFNSIDDYDRIRQVMWGTIPRHRTAMRNMLKSITPNFYNVTLYEENSLSPFNRLNRRYYKYNIKVEEGGLAVVHFKPHTPNTHLIKGYAIVDYSTGRLQSVQIEGEFDMVKYKTTALMNQKDLHTPLPERCSTEVSFRFMGNFITAHCTAVYNCPVTLPDSIEDKADKELMEQLRPIPLTPEDQRIYHNYEEEVRKEQEKAAAAAAADTTKVKKNRHNWLKEIGWDLIGDNLLNGNGTTKKTSNGSLSMSFSPLLNPLYFGYSHSRGFSYRLKLGFRYNWNTHRYLRFEPELGYSFKQTQLYYTIPLKMTYNPKRNGYAEIRLGNGNHISSATLAHDFHRILGDTVDMSDYRDNYIRIINNVVAYDWIEIMSGFIFHHRSAIHPQRMKLAGMETQYNSFAPLLTLRFTPWHHGPVLTVNYEQGLKNFLHSNLDYQRWELDAAYMLRTQRKQIINLRGGAGFYTQRNSRYFVDFSNFHDENLPSGWEDDWSGQFQLVDSRWYNSSNYYFRAHVSYDTPLLIMYKIPLIGRYVEAERIYLSALTIEHTRPYFELGYGFSNRLFSSALFASFLNTKIQEIGFKITVEIFSRW